MNKTEINPVGYYYLTAEGRKKLGDSIAKAFKSSLFGDLKPEKELKGRQE